MSGKDLQTLQHRVLEVSPGTGQVLRGPLFQPVPSNGNGHHPPRNSSARVVADGKFFQRGSERFFLKGLTYGPFAPSADGIFLPTRPRVRDDFRRIRALTANSIRVYHAPPEWLLDEAAEADLQVFIDVPWDKHRCFLEADGSQQDAIRRVSEAARLGGHPAVFAISVANEIPKDIVRYCGEKRVERFVHTLLDTVKQQAPECLVTYTNYPSTEFLRPMPVDFFCFNVYLEDPDRLGAYLTRLQHQAGNLPIVLGEHGFDSHHHGTAEQAGQVREQLSRVFRHGLAGSFVFSFTDDWFAGGEQVRNWAFGVTDGDRNEKPAARALREAWAEAPLAPPKPAPSVSVVVCSYNGGATLAECLRSLMTLQYPDYEVILVDDGSTDDTVYIAAQFPKVRYIHQENRGLSFARNVGAQHARGEIVAYTDSDCVADPYWLNYLVHEMRERNVHLIGGPNIPPPDDNVTAHCVALSPGGPSHIMLDDQRAEHVPGCNLACSRERLLELGGFDPQFRVAGDDVDICWRFLDAGFPIGYAPAAVVWHHRRNTVRAYLKQQAGYGRSEAMLKFKHPARFNKLGSALWDGVIYGEGATGLALEPPVVFHGRFGQELFPTIYRQSRVSGWAYVLLLEWHILAAFILLLSVLYSPLGFVPALMWLATLTAVIRAGWTAELPKNAAWWSRPLISLLHLLQPIVRAGSRYRYRHRHRRVPPSLVNDPNMSRFLPVTTMRPLSLEQYAIHEHGRGREQLLEHAVRVADEHGWRGDFHCQWEAWDLLLTGDNWHSIEIRTASEELGGGKRFTRARGKLRATGGAVFAAAAVCVWTILAIVCASPWAQWAGLIGCAGLAARLLWSRRTCRRAAAALIGHAVERAGIEPVSFTSTAPAVAEPEQRLCAPDPSPPVESPDIETVAAQA